MSLSIIVAVAQNGIIGRAGGLPWHLSADLRRFKQLTMGHTLIMGRKTHESIGRKLPGRENVIISRQPGYDAEGCEVVGDWSAAEKRIDGRAEAFVIGGYQIYKLALPHAQRLYWTQVAADVEGDVRFPPLDWVDWQLVHDEPHEADARNDYPFSFRVYHRR